MYDPKFRVLHGESWHNKGLTLPLSGEKDGDMDTIHIGHGRRYTDGTLNRDLRARALDEVYGKVINPDGTIKIDRPETPKDMTRDWGHLKRDDKEEAQCSKKIFQIKRSLRAWNDQHIKCFKACLDSDFSDRSNPLPTAGHILELADVQAMTKMFVKKFGPRGEHKLFNEILGLPVHDENGRIFSAAKKPLYDWSKVPVLKGQCIAKDAAIKRVLKEVEAHNTGGDGPLAVLNRTSAADSVGTERDFVFVMLNDEELPREWDHMKGEVYVRTIWKPSAADSMSRQQLDWRNASREKGIEFGYSWMDYDDWYDRFQIEVEERMLDTVAQTDQSSNIGTFNELKFLY